MDSLLLFYQLAIKRDQNFFHLLMAFFAENEYRLIYLGEVISNLSSLSDPIQIHSKGARQKICMIIQNVIYIWLY